MTPPSRLLRRLAHLGLLLATGAGTSACTCAPFAFSCETAIGGTVTLNGTPVTEGEVVVVEARREVARITPDAQGRFGVDVKDDYPEARRFCAEVAPTPLEGFPEQSAPGLRVCGFGGEGDVVVLDLAYFDQASVRIAAPPDGGVVTSPVALSAVWDRRMGLRPDVSASVTSPGAPAWTSSLDGPILTAASGTVSLSEGDHRLVAAYTTPAGFLAADTVQIRVDAPGGGGENGPPLVSIANPMDGASIPGGSVRLLGSAVDPESGTVPNDRLTWTSSIDGALGTGPSVDALLSPGAHTLTLDAADPEGLVGSASVSVTSVPVTGIRGRVTVGGIGVADVPVALDGPIVFTGVTDAAGDYIFVNLVPGTYRVRIVPPEGSTFPAEEQEVTVVQDQVAVVDFAGS